MDEIGDKIGEKVDEMLNNTKKINPALIDYNLNIVAESLFLRKFLLLGKRKEKFLDQIEKMNSDTKYYLEQIRRNRECLEE